MLLYKEAKLKDTIQCGCKNELPKLCLLGWPWNNPQTQAPTALNK